MNILFLWNKMYNIKIFCLPIFSKETPKILIVKSFLSEKQASCFKSGSISYRVILDLERRLSHIAMRMHEMKVIIGSPSSSGRLGSSRRRRAAASVSGRWTCTADNSA